MFSGYTTMIHPSIRPAVISSLRTDCFVHEKIGKLTVGISANKYDTEMTWVYFKHTSYNDIRISMGSKFWDLICNVRPFDW